MKKQKLPVVLPDDDGIRPAGKPDECFYCNQKVGTSHLSDCVILDKKIKIAYTFEIEIEVPHSWKRSDVEFHRNDSSWCASNAIGEIEGAIERAGYDCACPVMRARVVSMSKELPYRRNKIGQIVP